MAPKKRRDYLSSEELPPKSGGRGNNGSQGEGPSEGNNDEAVAAYEAFSASFDATKEYHLYMAMEGAANEGIAEPPVIYVDVDLDSDLPMEHEEPPVVAA